MCVQFSMIGVWNENGGYVLVCEYNIMWTTEAINHFIFTLRNMELFQNIMTIQYTARELYATL